MRPRWDTCEVSESTRFPELEGRRVDELARERGCSPLDVMCEIALAEDLDTRFRIYIANDDVDEVSDLLTHEHVALGLSDAGAHVGQLCDAPLPTDLLGTWVRDRGVMPLERAVRKLTGEPADLFGFVRRGYLREGAGPTCACSTRRRSAPDRCGGCATSRREANASPRRSRRECVTCSSTGRPSVVTVCSSTLPTCVPVRAQEMA